MSESLTSRSLTDSKSLTAPLRLVVLISGRGSNLEALLKAIETGALHAKVVAVISNRSDAKGLALAESRSIPTEVLSHRDFDSRELFDVRLADRIDAYTPGLVILAGFMRILTSAFVNRFFPRLLNIHPSLLPAFPGLHTHESALQEGIKVHGCTVHAVTDRLDHGPILGQGVVPVLADDSADTLAARVLQIEHQLFPAVIQAIAEKQWVPVSTGWAYTAAPSTSLNPKGFWHLG